LQRHQSGIKAALPERCSSSSSSSSTSSSKERETKTVSLSGARVYQNGFYPDEGWLEFKREYPNDKSIFVAQPEYLTKLDEAPDPATAHQQIIAGCRRARAYWQATATATKYQPNAVDFLKDAKYLESWAIDSPRTSERSYTDVVREMGAKKLGVGN
jgi:hypothetical protein